MATNMVSKIARKRLIPLADLTAGQRLKVQILNADDTLVEELCDDDVPAAKTGKSLSVCYNIEIE